MYSDSLTDNIYLEYTEKYYKILNKILKNIDNTEIYWKY